MSRVGPLNATAIGRLGALADHGGFLQLNGPLRIPLSRVNNTTAETSVLFPQHGPRDLTTITIGRVQSGTSIEDIQNQYPKLSDLLSAMFNVISEPTLVPSGAGLYYVEPVLEYEAGTTASITISLNMDRGVWFPTQTSGGAVPYGSVTRATLEHPITSQLIQLNIPLLPHGRNVLLTDTRSIAIPSTLTSFAVASADAVADTAAGELAYNSKSVLSQTEARSWIPNNSFLLRNFYYVWLNEEGTLNNAPANPNESNLPSTSKLFFDTQYVIVAGHTNEQILIRGREPLALAQYESFFNKWFEQRITDGAWTKTQVGEYWVITMSSSARLPADFRISF